MSESLRSRMRALGTLGNRVGTILPGTKLICALVAIFALINFFAHDSKTLFSISTSFLSLPPKIWVFFSAVFYETSTLMVKRAITSINTITPIHFIHSLSI